MLLEIDCSSSLTWKNTSLPYFKDKYDWLPGVSNLAAGVNHFVFCFNSATTGAGVRYLLLTDNYRLHVNSCKEHREENLQHKHQTVV